MFARPRPKKLLAPPPKKRKRQHTLEEIKFDNDARAEYLTGFHKRKLQRAKHAQEQAAERARQEKIEARKQIREDRKRQVEEHVQSVNEALKQAAQAGYIDSEGGESSDEDSAEEWGGFEDTSGQQATIDHEEQYVDEDRYTTVTVESVNVSRDGLTSSRPDEEDSADENEDGEKELDKKTAVQPEKTGNRDKHEPKKKKQKFRYETKLERQITNIKQKAKNKRRPRG
ncbi:nucleolar protein 12-domain-containing protein [Xylaria bambusicola]|uniref:nucleolar protein 12-domain-containing protein n=1 Tax=Xylaria bambusicola TaxID=326684 RepID=UPI002007B6D0|nr:nucleolar protein 12-domain-containing protein [Xylaria bambusicola]KAI0503305.1 nucleolar protein 12-domain-containing protein [Xylaria bambusicola]